MRHILHNVRFLSVCDDEYTERIEITSHGNALVIIQKKRAMLVLCALYEVQVSPA